MKAYKLAIFSLVAGFATAAVASEIAATTTVSERKSCDEIAAEISELSAITEPDDETTAELNKLKQQQRSFCHKRVGARGTMSKSRRTPVATDETLTDATESSTESTVDNGCDTPDENGCCPGEKYTDMGDLGFNCCPETGGDCFPPMAVTTKTEESTISPELTDDERAANIEAGLCADGTKPNKFGCCGDEVFTDLGNTVFACCPKSGGDCFPPIK